MKIKTRHIGLGAVALLIATGSAITTAQRVTPEALFQKTQISAFAGPLQTEPRFDRLIIKFKETASTRAGVFDFNAARSQVNRLDSSAALPLTTVGPAGLSYLKSVGAQTHVALTAKKLSRAELFALAKQIEQDPQVAYAEIDEIAHPHFTPTDPAFQTQWHYQAASAHRGGANLPAVWDRTTGSGVVVAVIDSGVRPHPDLAANLLPGYDFVSDITAANDGDAFDNNASDPGDWEAAGACGSGSLAKDSSWHGTHVAGTIAAVANNVLGGVGVAFGAKILPVRVLGVCGGFSSDIAAGMRWAAGLNVPDVPANPHKARVLNLSLGGRGLCSAFYQETVDAVRAAGSIVVASTGNDGKPAVGSPANCAGVIAVTAHTRQGDHAVYGNIGAETTLSAPGGGAGAMALADDGAPIFSTANTGITVPREDSYAGYVGTSMAAPHVAGIAALLFSLHPAITSDTLRSTLVSSARPHPADTFCANRTDCGAGLVDAKAAMDRLNSLAPSVTASASPEGVHKTGSTIGITARATAGSGGNTAFSYQWTQLAGPPVTLSNTTAASTSFVAAALGASYTFNVKVTDGAGWVTSSDVSVTANTAPVLTPIPAQTVVQGGHLSFTALATDAEKTPVAFVTSGLPEGASLNPATGVFSWYSAGPAGTHSFTVTPNDGAFSGTPQTVTIAVTPAPAAGSSNGSGSGGGGSMGWLDLFALMLLAVSAVVFRRKQSARRQNH